MTEVSILLHFEVGTHELTSKNPRIDADVNTNSNVYADVYADVITVVPFVLMCHATLTKEGTTEILSAQELNMCLTVEEGGGVVNVHPPAQGVKLGTDTVNMGTDSGTGSSTW